MDFSREVPAGEYRCGLGFELLRLVGTLGAELFSQAEPILQPIQNNHPVCAHISGQGRGVEAQAAGSLNHHALPGMDAGPQPVATMPMAQLTGPSSSSGSWSGTRKKG